MHAQSCCGFGARASATRVHAGVFVTRVMNRQSPQSLVDLLVEALGIGGGGSDRRRMTTVFVFVIVVIVYIFSTSQRRLDSFVYAFVILIVLVVVVVVFFLAGIIFIGVKSFRCRMFFIVVTDSWSDASAVAEPGGEKNNGPD